LYKSGWRGINVDPNIDTIKLFNKYRPMDTNLHLGVSKSEQDLTYYNFTHSGVNTFSKEHAEMKSNSNGNKLIDTQLLKCVPLSKILDENLKNSEQIDVLDIDVEGLDLEVLESNNWDKYRPKVILVEDREFRDQMQDSAIFSFLNSHGYTFHSYQNITLVMTLGFKS